MSDLIVVPSVVPTLNEWLEAQTEVSTFSSPSPRVVTQLPVVKPGQPPQDGFMIRVIQFNDQQRSNGPIWYVANFVQVDVFGGPTSGARRLAEICRSLLSYRFAGDYDELVVRYVTVSGLRDEPDEAFTPARPRWMFTSEIFTRPIPGGS